MPRSSSRFLIVTPSYNQAQFIGQTIESVLGQDFGNVEYVVMDGGSRDGTVDILKKYGKKIDWVSEKDHGQTDAINKGIAHFKKSLPQFNKSKKSGSLFFAYINSDDYYLPGTFAKVAQAFVSHPEAMWVVGDCQIVDADSRVVQAPIRWYKRLFRQCYRPWMLYILNPLPQPAVFLRATAVSQVGSFNIDLRYVMDYEYWLRMQKVFGPPLFIDSPLAAFRVHQASIGGSQFVPQFQQEYQIARRFTKNPICLFFHLVHNWAIVLSYLVLK